MPVPVRTNGCSSTAWRDRFEAVPDVGNQEHDPLVDAGEARPAGHNEREDHRGGHGREIGEPLPTSRPPPLHRDDRDTPTANAV